MNLVPRWKYQPVDVPYLEEAAALPSVFNNDTWWRWRLIGLSFCADNDETRSSLPNWPINYADWARYILVDIGKSGRSDQNVIAGTLASLCPSPRLRRQKMGANQVGRVFNLETPYLLPRNQGLRVKVHNRMWKYGEGSASAQLPAYTAFMAKGVDASGQPKLLAGETEEVLNIGSSVTLKSADLFNDGKDPIWLTQFCYKDMSALYSTDDQAFFYRGSGANIGWSVNPDNSSVTQFMPSSSCIPVGCLAPMGVTFDGGLEGPLCYSFPKNTYLDPTQKLSVRLGSLKDSGAITLHICLFGELEVR